MQLDHVQLEVMNEAIDIEEVAHQCHQAISYIQEVIQHFKLKKTFDFILFSVFNSRIVASPFVRRSKRKMSKFQVPTFDSMCC